MALAEHRVKNKQRGNTETKSKDLLQMNKEAVSKVRLIVILSLSKY